LTIVLLFTAVSPHSDLFMLLS